MRSRSHRSRQATSVAFAVCAALFAACSGPFVLLPGGRLEGEVVPVPGDWAFTDEISTIQIETRPDDPYSVNIWVVAIGPHLYLHAGASRSTWVEHLENDPRLRVRIDEKLYELAAARVTEAGEFARFADVYEEKYGVRPRNENVSEVYLLRLGPRG